MKFYVIEFRDDSMPEGIAYEFFRTKKEATKYYRAIKKETKKVCYCDYTCPDDCEEHYKDESGYVQLKTIQIPKNLTTKEKVFYALRYQVV